MITDSIAITDLHWWYYNPCDTCEVSFKFPKEEDTIISILEVTTKDRSFASKIADKQP